MARVDNLTNFVIDICNSTRKMTGKTEPILLSNLDKEIESIQAGGAEPNLQSKDITITTNGIHSITADEGYDGLNEVNVTASVSGSTMPTKGYIIDSWNDDGYPTKITIVGLDNIPAYYFYYNYNPSGSSYGSGLSPYITEIILPTSIIKINPYGFYGCHNLLNLNTTNIAIVGEYAFYRCRNITNIDLSKTNALYIYTFYQCTNLKTISLSDSLTTIGGYCFQLCGNLELVVLPDSITSIGGGGMLVGGSSYTGNAFNSCTKLALTKLPDSLTTISGNNNFYKCTCLAIKTLPDGVSSIPAATFYGCTSIIQLSMLNVTTIIGTSAATGAFASCTSLKAVWIGSSITSTGFARFSFYGCTNLLKMYIDLPRATVESFTNYQYAFMSDTTKTSIIVCNDDDDFITKAAFDIIDWSNYMEVI